MALLHYENLGVRNAHSLLRSARHGLRDFDEYLKQTILHLESEDSVLRLAWKRAAAPSGFSESKGTWIELCEPEDRPNEPERTFDAFLDEEVRKLFELERGRESTSGRPERIDRSKKLTVLDRDPGTYRLLLHRAPEL